jgi:hypothetical protein
METRRPEIDEFSARRGETFRMQLGGDQVLALELVEVHDRGRSAVGGPDRSCFALLFRSRGENRFAPQRTYTVEHEALGAIEMFLVPRGPDGQGMTYEAIYN